MVWHGHWTQVHKCALAHLSQEPASFTVSDSDCELKAHVEIDLDFEMINSVHKTSSKIK